MSKITASKQEKENKCSYCGKQYKTKKGFEKHICRQLTRVKARDQKPVRLALHLYNVFRKTQTSNLVEVDFVAFETSPYYDAFVKFSTYCLDTKVFDSEAFIKWLLKSNVRLDSWASDAQYDKFIVNYLREEPALTALTRTIEYSIEWAEKKKVPSNKLLLLISDFEFVRAIQNGKLSPWIVCLTSIGINRISNLPEQLQASVWDYVQIDEWHKIFVDRRDEAKQVREFLKLGKWE